MNQINYALLSIALATTPSSIDCAKELPATRTTFNNLKITSTAALTSKGLFKNISGKLVLKFKNSKDFTFRDFVDSDDETAIRTHDYLGFSPVLDRFVVQLKYYERSEILLISKSCEVDTLWEIPYVSADGKMAVALSRGVEYEVYNNGFQIFGIGPKGLFKVCEKKIIGYEPIALRWSGNKSFVLKAINPLAKTKIAVYKRYSL